MTATVSGNGQNVTLATNTYDDYGASGLTSRDNLTTHDAAYTTGHTRRGNVTRTAVPGSARNLRYDIGGLLVRSQDDYGHVFDITVSASNNYAAPSAITQTANSTTYQNSFTYNAALFLTGFTGMNNENDTKTYDSYGRLSSTTSVYQKVTSYAYDYTQHTVTASVTSGPMIGVTPRVERTTTDGFGRTIRQEAGATVSQMLSIVDTEYAPCACSPLGKVSRVSTPYAQGETSRHWTSYQYDATGRTTSATAPDGVSATTYLYQGNRTRVTDPAGKWKIFTTDAVGNLTRVEEPNPQGGANLVTQYTYDALNHLTQVSMPRSGVTQTRSFVYDAATQRLSSVSTPESGTVTFSYRGDGMLWTKTDAKGQVTRYGYDGVPRVTSIEFLPDGTNPDPCQTISYGYDLLYVPEWGGIINGMGRVVAVNWNGGVNCSYSFAEQYAYDAAGTVSIQRLKVSTGSMNPIKLDMVYWRDAEGRLAQVNVPAPHSLDVTRVINYTIGRDALGRPTTLSRNFGVPTIVSGATYTAAGQLEQLSSQYYTETRQYNVNQQLTRITASSATQTMDLTYAYPAANNGRIQSVTDNVTGEQVTYLYDQLNRLIQAGAATFAYDGFGNLTQQDSVAVSVNPQTNQIAASGYGYDANGNLTQTPTAAYTYDAGNRLVSNGATYDPRNRRVFDGQYLYLYRVDGKLAARYQIVTWGSGYTPSRAYIDGLPNEYFGGRLLSERGKWVMTDRLGSVRVNSSGERSDYKPYGGETAPTTDGRTKFATYTRDGGLDYAMNRYYTPGIGRFLTPDPSSPGSAADPGSWNRYAYVQGDPVNYRDPLGLASCSVSSNSTRLSDDGNAYDRAEVNCVGALGSLVWISWVDANNRSNKEIAKDALSSIGDWLDRTEREYFVQNAVAGATDRLFSKDCAGLFLSPNLAGDINARRGLSQQLWSLWAGQNSIRIYPGRSVSGPSVPAEATGTSGTIRVFVDGGFFTGTDDSGKSILAATAGGAFAGMTLADFQQLVIIHEFMHWSGIVGDDNAGQAYTLPNGDQVSGSQGISQEVRSKCFQ